MGGFAGQSKDFAETFYLEENAHDEDRTSLKSQDNSSTFR